LIYIYSLIDEIRFQGNKNSDFQDLANHLVIPAVFTPIIGCPIKLLSVIGGNIKKDGLHKTQNIEIL
jgi:hypothetical protein